MEERLLQAEGQDEEESVVVLTEMVGPQSKASMGTTTFNLVNNMVGSGLLSIPWCMFQLRGSVSGTLFLAVLALVTWSSFALIGLVCSRHKHVKSFDELAALAGLPQVGTKVLLALYTWLSCVSYVLLTCDFVAGESGLSRFEWSCTRSSKCSWIVEPFKHRIGVVAFLVVFVLYPFSRFKDFSSLKRVSVLSFAAMLCMMVVALYTFTTRRDDDDDMVDFYQEEESENTNLLKGVFLAHPIFLISFTAHYNAPKFFAELEQASSYRFAVSSAMAVLAAFAIYGFFGIVSYETFLGTTKSNVLMNYSSESYLAVFARFAMSIVVLTTYPLAYQAMKGALSVFLEGTRIQPYSDIPLVLATALPAALIHDIGVVLDYKGTVLGGVVALLVPSLAVLRVFATEKGDPLPIHQQDEGQEMMRMTPIVRKDRWTWYARWSRILVCWAIIASIGGFLATTLRLLGKI